MILCKNYIFLMGLMLISGGVTSAYSAEIKGGNVAVEFEAGLQQRACPIKIEGGYRDSGDYIDLGTVYNGTATNVNTVKGKKFPIYISFNCNNFYQANNVAFSLYRNYVEFQGLTYRAYNIANNKKDSWINIYKADGTPIRNVPIGDPYLQSDLLNNIDIARIDPQRNISNHRFTLCQAELEVKNTASGYFETRVGFMIHFN